MNEALTRAVERLSRVPGVRGALVVETRAGVPVVEEVREGEQAGAVAALAAALYGRAGRAVESAGFGGLVSLQLEGRGGHLVAAGAGDLVVVALADADAALGLVRLEVQRAAEAVR